MSKASSTSGFIDLSQDGAPARSSPAKPMASQSADQGVLGAGHAAGWMEARDSIRPHRNDAVDSNVRVPA
jgi:hypothetical protein